MTSTFCTVLCVRQNVAHKQSLRVEMDGCYQPVLIAAYVKNVKVASF
jgi:hypothetical protein